MEIETTDEKERVKSDDIFMKKGNELKSIKFSSEIQKFY